VIIVANLRLVLSLLIMLSCVAACDDDEYPHCVKDVWNSQTEACPEVWR
jgi:hypothetical protein